MIAHEEIEAKWTMERAGFDLLLSSCRLLKRVEQLNVYFDNQWALARVGATCRLRFTPREAVLFTLKVPDSWGADGTRRARELEMPAQAAFGRGFSAFWRTFDPAGISPSVGEALQAINVARLERVGWMRNARHVLKLPSGEVFELDRFTLPGGEICYEAEVEDADGVRRDAIVAWIRRLVPTASPSRLSKFERFTQAAQGRLSRKGTA